MTQKPSSTNSRLKAKPSFISSSQLRIRHPDRIPVSVGCVYGDVDAGKTWLLCSAIEHFGSSSVLLITLDRHDPTLFEFPELGYVDFIEFASGKNYKEALKELAKWMRFEAPRRKVKFVGFDSVSKLAHLMNASQSDTEVAEQSDYLKTQNAVSEFVWDMNDAAIKGNFHLWYTAWERDEWIDVIGSDSKGFTKYYPDLAPGLGRIIRHDWSFLGRMTLERQRFSLNSKGAKFSTRVIASLDLGSKYAVTKNRFHLPSKIESPTVGKVLELAGMAERKEGMSGQIRKLDDPTTNSEVSNDGEVSPKSERVEAQNTG